MTRTETNTFRFYYAAPLGLATHTIYVDGVKRGVVRYNDNGKSLGWGSFSEDIYADIHLTLTKGTHTLRIEKTEAALVLPSWMLLTEFLAP